MEGQLIFKKISDTMKEIGAIGKNKRNTQGNGFMYRGVDDVMNALEPAMEKNGLFITPEVLEQTREERTSKNGGALIYSICKIRFTFYAEDGSNVQATVIGEAMDSGDKATNKAMSIAFKYACFQVFCIPTEEMKDPDAETHEVAKKNDTIVYACEECNKPFTPFDWKGKHFEAKDGYEIAKKNCNGKALCNDCKKKAGF